MTVMCNCSASTVLYFLQDLLCQYSYEYEYSCTICNPCTRTRTRKSLRVPYRTVCCRLPALPAGPAQPGPGQALPRADDVLMSESDDERPMTGSVPSSPPGAIPPDARRIKQVVQRTYCNALPGRRGCLKACAAESILKISRAKRYP